MAPLEQQLASHLAEVEHLRDQLGELAVSIDYETRREVKRQTDALIKRLELMKGALEETVDKYADREDIGASAAEPDDEFRITEAGLQSFPASDPPSYNCGS